MYGAVADIAQMFSPGQWNPATGQPDSATVTAWLTNWSSTLDGELGQLVQVPVDPLLSPKLCAVCTSITELRVRAEIYDLLYPPAGADRDRLRPSAIWRDQAAGLVTAIQGGATGDGVVVRAGQPAAAGQPLGDVLSEPVFKMRREY
jgi:hypothetical protein